MPLEEQCQSRAPKDPEQHGDEDDQPAPERTVGRHHEHDDQRRRRKHHHQDIAAQRDVLFEDDGRQTRERHPGRGPSRLARQLGQFGGGAADALDERPQRVVLLRCVARMDKDEQHASVARGEEALGHPLGAVADQQLFPGQGGGRLGRIEKTAPLVEKEVQYLQAPLGGGNIDADLAERRVVFDPLEGGAQAFFEGGGVGDLHAFQKPHHRGELDQAILRDEQKGMFQEETDVEVLGDRADIGKTAQALGEIDGETFQLDRIVSIENDDQVRGGAEGPEEALKPYGDVLILRQQRLARREDGQVGDGDAGEDGEEGRDGENLPRILGAKSALRGDEGLQCQGVLRNFPGASGPKGWSPFSADGALFSSRFIVSRIPRDFDGFGMTLFKNNWEPLGTGPTRNPLSPYLCG
jgi:hypothetical protein